MPNYLYQYTPICQFPHLRRPLLHLREIYPFAVMRLRGDVLTQLTLYTASRLRSYTTVTRLRSCAVTRLRGYGVTRSYAITRARNNNRYIT